ncbi:MAG: hypothetical protein CMF74_12620 [Maricaulis sp.]|nr:hypothetical protein [Maricaulis sp.]
MIDTDKYEGHTEGPWGDIRPFGIPLYDLSLKIIDEEIQIEEDGVYRWEIPQDSGRAEMTDWTRYTWEEVKEIDANKALITDAPLLLQEFKRLREAIVDMIDSMDNYYIRDIQHATDCLRDMIGYYEDEEE